MAGRGILHQAREVSARDVVQTRRETAACAKL